MPGPDPADDGPFSLCQCARGLADKTVDDVAVDVPCLARAIGPEGQVQRQTEIATTLEDIADGFSILYRRTPLEISCVYDLDLMFFVARHDLEAMVSNLVSNAHKFAQEKVILSAEL